jgi:CHAD domain-containing protein
MARIAKPHASASSRATEPSPGRATSGSGPGPRPRIAAARLLRQKTATLFRHFPAALTGDEEALHQVRVWSRRLRVALRLLCGKPQGRRARRAQRLLAELTRTAGSARDLDVLLESFAARLGQVPTRTAEQKRLRQRLAAMRRRGRARLVQRLLDLPIARLRADLAGLATRACPDLTVLDRRFRSLCERESRKLEGGFAALGALLDVVALHALRRRARRLRYAVEVFLQVFGGEAAASKPWKALQDHIGTLHDHQVLAQWFDRQAAADKKRGHPALATAAIAEAAWARDTMQRLHAEFLAADPAGLVRRGLDALGLSVPSSPS